ncbi:MAG: leucine-rich repeat domain-containing protein [Holosporales bacterium]|nr:leucine-rich repeat domain-containing protein [Holosporales bacterium]
MAGAAQTIGDGVFYNCNALKTIEFPVIKTIGIAAFFYCRTIQIADFPIEESIVSRFEQHRSPKLKPLSKTLFATAPPTNSVISSKHRT